MSIYFFSSEAGVIKALCGVKVMVVPTKIAKAIKQKLDRIAEKNISPENLASEFGKGLKENILSPELKEEYNHFKCLIHSKAANFFHIRNVMLRHSYSNYTHHRIVNPTIPHRALYRDVIRYYMDYVRFHYAAYPLIEAHHLFFLEEKEDQKEHNDILYPKRIKEALHFLQQNNRDVSDIENSYRYIATCVDRNFITLLKRGKKALEESEYVPGQIKQNNKTRRTFFLLLCMFGKLAKRPILWKNLCRILFSHLRLVRPYILGRLFPSVVKKKNTGTLPSILSEGIHIDPAAFHYREYALKGREKSFPSTHHGGLANLFWHILSRCAVIISLLELGVSELQLNRYFKKLRLFNQEWRPKIEKAQFEMSVLDNDIIYTIASQYDFLSRKDRPEQIRCLETISITLFKKYRDKDFFDFKNSDSSHNSAINCTYMHL